MNKKLLLVALVFVSSIGLAAAATEQEVVDRCAAIMRGFRSIPETEIPASVMRNAKGLAILSVFKVGSALAAKVVRAWSSLALETAGRDLRSSAREVQAGASLEGAIIATQKTANTRYYGRPVSATAILSGQVAPPPGASRLRAALR